MIDPSNITNYNLSTTELEEHILFWVCAAGKNGRAAARSLDKFLIELKKNLAFYYEFTLSSIYTSDGPFARICMKSLDDYLNSKGVQGRDPYHEYLPDIMKRCGIGCYNNKARTFEELARSNLDLRTCSTYDLERIYGIGKKTSRCFILHSRKDAEVSGLDTHMLKYLRDRGVENVPKSTPISDTKYKRLEKEVLNFAREADMSPAKFDLMIWNKFSRK